MSILLCTIGRKTFKKVGIYLGPLCMTSHDKLALWECKHRLKYPSTKVNYWLNNIFCQLNESIENSLQNPCRICLKYIEILLYLVTSSISSSDINKNSDDTPDFYDKHSQYEWNKARKRLKH